jgi:pyrroloquinoline-quinone synthase
MEPLAQLETAIAERHLLEHPFYKAWTDGTLPREALADYVRQYYAFETHLPRFFTALHARSDDAATRAALLANAWDEEHGENNHPELWLRFADALGVSRLSVADAKLHDATRALVATYREAAQRAPIACGIAALYAYEAQLPAIAEAKIAGLKAHYDVHGREGLSFFEVHRAVDVHHAAAERRLLEQSTASSDDSAVTLWASRALDAWWAFLDGVQDRSTAVPSLAGAPLQLP